MRSPWWLGLACAACGAAPPSTLQALAHRQLIVIADFDPPAPQPPAIAAFLTYDGVSPCPALAVAAELDGVPLAPAPAGTGFTGNNCQLAFVLTAAPPPAAAQSTLRFSDASGAAALTAAHLLDRRALTSALAGGSTVHAGDTVPFTWPTAGDQITAAGGSFLQGTTKTPFTAQVNGTDVRVSVPSLASGAWTIGVSAVAQAAVAACPAGATCSAQVAGRGALDVTIP